MSSATKPQHDQQLMHCMEVWGGNQTIDTSLQIAGLDAHVYSKPFGGSAGGGDVYYVSACATGRITRLLIADVCGHGATVCDTAATLRGLMRRYVNFIDQTKFVRAMNEQFTAMSAANCFATAIVTTFFAPTGRLSLCNAGHPPPLLYRAATDEWSILEESPATAEAMAADDRDLNIPLGLIDATPYEQFEVDLEVGDAVVCYTDALIESCDAQGGDLGTRGLLDCARRTPRPDAADFVPRLLAHLTEQNPRNLANDDVTVLLFRANGTGRTTPLRDKSLAPWRVLRGTLRALYGRERPPLPELSVANVGGALVDRLSHAGHRKDRRPAKGTVRGPAEVG